MCGCLNDASWIRSEPVRASAMEFGRPSSAAAVRHAEQTWPILKFRLIMRDKQLSNSRVATTNVSEKRMRCSYVIFGVSATVGTHSLIRRRSTVMHRGDHFCLLGVSSLRVSVSPVSFSGCSSVPAPSACLLRLTAAGAPRCSCTTRPPVETERPWCALMRTPSLQPGSARPPLTTKTCPRVTEYVGPRAYI